MTHKEEVLLFIKENGSISTLECATELFIVDLQSVIKSLRRDGYKIVYKWVYAVSRYGKPIRYKRYKLEEFTDKFSSEWKEY